MKKWLSLVLFVGLACRKPVDELPPAPPKGEIKARALDAAKKAVSFFEKTQGPDGSWGKGFKVGVTSLAVWAQVSSPLKLDEKNRSIDKAVSYVLSSVRENGSICIPDEHLANYNTSIAVLALKSLKNPKYDETIAKAKEYLLSCQRTDVPESDPAYGGVSYERGSKAKLPDASNTGFWMDALKATGLKADDEAFKRALVFWKRVCNNPEVSDLEFAAAAAGTPEYGGAIYRPGGEDASKAGRFTSPSGKVGWRVYGSMTYNWLMAMIYCGAKKDSKAVKGAFDWISHNYTLDENPGLGAQGQYYYYHTFAKALDAVGEKYVLDENDVRHEWAKELAEKLLRLQKPDGSWVNEAMRWAENDPALATAYSLRALSIAMEWMDK